MSFLPGFAQDAGASGGTAPFFVGAVQSTEYNASFADVDVSALGIQAGDLVFVSAVCSDAQMDNDGLFYVNGDQLPGPLADAEEQYGEWPDGELSTSTYHFGLTIRALAGGWTTVAVDTASGDNFYLVVFVYRNVVTYDIINENVYGSGSASASLSNASTDGLTGYTRIINFAADCNNASSTQMTVTNAQGFTQKHDGNSGPNHSAFLYDKLVLDAPAADYPGITVNKASARKATLVAKLWSNDLSRGDG